MCERLADGCPTIILFTRIPVPGRVKTRLLPALSGEECAQLQKAMLLDEAERLEEVCRRCGRPRSVDAQSADTQDATANPSDSGLSLAIYYSDETVGLPDSEASALRERFYEQVRLAAPSARLERQTGEGLGARMHNALCAELAAGAPWCILMGSDLPLVTCDLVEKAIAAFEGEGWESGPLGTPSDVVLCPSDDGGYWLVGLRRPCPELFSGKRYGVGSVLAEALATCCDLGLAVALGPSACDLDTPDELERLRALAQSGDPRIGERTMAWLGE